MNSVQELPKTHRALVLTSTSEAPEIKILPIPQPTPGSVIVRIEVANIVSYSKDIYNGVRAYPFPTPLIIGTSAIGRIAATGPDATLLKPGQLVFVDCYIRGRDDPTASILLGIHEGRSEGSRKLMQGEWRDGTYAEFSRMPLENCFVLDDKILCGRMGYGIEDLQEISRLVVPYGGLSDIKLKPGETIIVAPATGPFGSAAVKVALAMGARVIAMGRNLHVLQNLATIHERVEIVQITGDVQADTDSLQSFGPINAFFDISPPAAENSTHIRSAILALKHSGRVSFMSGINGDISIPLSLLVHRDLQIKGKWMYSTQDVKNLIKMVEAGVLKLGGQQVRRFELIDWEKGFDAAARMGGNGAAVIAP